MSLPTASPPIQANGFVTPALVVASYAYGPAPLLRAGPIEVGGGRGTASPRCRSNTIPTAPARRTRIVRTVLLLGLLAGALAGCSGLPANPLQNSRFTAFTPPSAMPWPWGITAGPDGNVWFTESPETDHGNDPSSFGSKIGRITPAGQITEFALPPRPDAQDVALEDITTGPDGNLWFTESSDNKIGRMTPTGEVTEFLLLNNGGGPDGITVGPDGNLWYTRVSGYIGRITPSGDVAEFRLPSRYSTPAGITRGPDGNLWFTEMGGHIGRITPSGQITEFGSGLTPQGCITTGPDGNLWYADNHYFIGRVSPAGEVTQFSLPENSQAVCITTGPDGNLWYTDENNAIGRITPTGQVSTQLGPFAGFLVGMQDITTGPDGNLWFTESEAGKVGRMKP